MLWWSCHVDRVDRSRTASYFSILTITTPTLRTWYLSDQYVRFAARLPSFCDTRVHRRTECRVKTLDAAVIVTIFNMLSQTVACPRWTDYLIDLMASKTVKGP